MTRKKNESTQRANGNLHLVQQQASIDAEPPVDWIELLIQKPFRLTMLIRVAQRAL